MNNIIKVIEALNESRTTESPVTIFHAGTRLYNAKGTTGDRVVNLSSYDKIEARNLLEAWQDLTGSILPIECPNKCCAAKNKNARFNLVGAHVLKSHAEHDIRTGEEVYIVPLCNSCNTSGSDMDIVLDEDLAGLRLIWNESDVKK
jgi:hypothetical protein